MKKRTLQEEIDRIHTISYGKKVLFEDELLDKLLKGDPSTKSVSKIDDPKLADLVSDDVNEFYNSLTSASTSGGLTQQQRGNMKYQKEVESMQIGLILLGYELPIYGVDGLFGPETASTVTRFSIDNVIKKSPFDDDNVTTSKTVTATPEMLDKLIELLKNKGVESKDLKPLLDRVTTGGGASFTDIDLKTNEGFTKYSAICDKFISTRQPNPLGITGEMMSNGAKNAFERYGKYVPPELALAQLVVEGGIGNRNPNIRPIKTKNPFNVGNVDNGSNVQYGNVQNSINVYYNLIAKNYLGKGKSANDLVTNFVNHSGNRYATEQKYEKMLNQVASQANKIAQTIA
jgi:hypothetical protein